MRAELDPRHAQQRNLLRALGIGFVMLGLLFLVCGTVSFFSSFGTSEPPRYFWCAFVGLPLLFVGHAAIMRWRRMRSSVAIAALL